jgi:membrane protease YdiL (CAAX protease family)
VTPEPSDTRWGLGEVVIAYVVSLIAATVATGVAVASGAAQQSIPTLAAGLGGEWVGFIGVPVVLSSTRGTGSVVRDFGLRLSGWADVGRGVVLGLGTYVLVLDVAYAPFLRLLQVFVGHKVTVGQRARQLGSLGRGPGFVVFAVLVTVGAPLAEELFFRGLLLRSLERRLGAWWAVVGSAVLFGLAHIGSTEGAAIPALVIFGIVLALAAQRTGRLGPGIVAHMAFNGLTVVALAASR